MSQTFENSALIHPTLHHFGVVTRHLEEMVDWYAKVLGMVTVHQSSAPLGKEEAPSSLRAVWVANDRANHRIGLISSPDLRDDPVKHTLSRLQHVAFEYVTLDDLLNTYTRLKGLLIEPLLAADHGSNTSLYYADPDGNSVELLVDNFGSWDESSEYIRTSPEFAAKPMGTYVDPEQMIAARKAGASFAELHRRAYAGEFAPSGPVDPRVLL
jgi:catechol 2,3-dioxygenase